MTKQKLFRTGVAFTFSVSVILWFGLAGIADATSYYVKPDGNDNLNGKSDATAWRTISKINSSSFGPGDGIFFKAGGVWREELIASWSGEEGKPITFTKYGSGPNPIIRASEQIQGSDWVKESDNIYSFSIKSADSAWLTAWGMEDSQGNLMSRHWPSYKRESKYTAPSNYRRPVTSQLETNMINGFSWMPKDLGKVFVRSNSGNPGNMEVGKRANCVYIEDKHDITFDSINFFGPTGGNEDSRMYSALVMALKSPRITVSNGVIRNSSQSAIQFRDTSHYSVAENNVIESTWNGVLGYGDCNYVVVRNNRFMNIGAQVASTGDRTVVGTWGHHWLVEDNYIENHGWVGEADSENVQACRGDISKCPRRDRAIASCCAKLTGVESSHHIIRRNYFKNLGGGAIRMIGGGHHQIYHNIIDGFNQYPVSHRERMSGAMDFATWDKHTPNVYKNIKVYNNVITGGADTQCRDYVIFFSGAHQGLEIKNNIVHGNHEDYLFLDFKSRSYTMHTHFEIENNLFEIKNPSRNGVHWYGTFFTYDHLISPTGCPNPGYWQCDKANTRLGIVRNNFSGNPLFVNPSAGDFRLQSNSPAIDAGLDVGLSVDYSGNSVPHGTAPDLGAHEYGSSERDTENP